MKVCECVGGGEPNNYFGTDISMPTKFLLVEMKEPYFDLQKKTALPSLEDSTCGPAPTTFRVSGSGAVPVPSCCCHLC